MAEESASGGGRVSGKVALVTGAASGIGKAVALLLATEGAAVAAADRDEAGVRQTAEEVAKRGGRATGYRLDVTDEAAWESAMNRLLAEFGGLHVAVNSAGVASAGTLADTTLAEWRRVLAVNLDGVFLGTRAALAAMRPHKNGSIINISSASGLKALPGAGAYCVGKAGVCMLTRVAALECAREGTAIRVNAVLPGGVKTPIWRGVPMWEELAAKEGGAEGAFAALGRGVPLGRYAEPEEVARAVLYLASDESAYVTGAELVIDGGFTA